MKAENAAVQEQYLCAATLYNGICALHKHLCFFSVFSQADCAADLT